ncbi:MAG: hypothetical protein IJ640_02815 [Prevotella sp.]|nr:hypothetical protein [Prevotella sp.]
MANTRENNTNTASAGNTQEKKIVPKKVDINQFITVRNGFQGRLVYISTRTGERYVWDSFGAEQELELRELRNAKNSNKKFFVNNWFMFDEEWVIDYLGVGQFYKNSLKLSEFDEIFEKSPEEIHEIISKMPEGQKKSLAYRARELVIAGEIDSRKMITALEESLGIELIEK